MLAAFTVRSRTRRVPQLASALRQSTMTYSNPIRSSSSASLSKPPQTPAFHNTTRHQSSSTTPNTPSVTSTPQSTASSSRTTSPLKTSGPNASIPAPHSPLTILFTDIESSSHLWDLDPAAMFAAMLAHDQLLRRYMAKHRGYEVKQNGDGFMIAFQRPRDALEFCLGVQGAFLGQKGVDESGVGVEGEADSDGSGLVEDAAEMVENKLGLETRGQIDREVAAKRYEDIRLRMSLHHGDVFEQINPVTQRADYMGPSVNRAARYVQATEPGMIVGSLEFVEALKTEWTEGDVVSGDGSEATSGRFEIRSMGMRKFKGVEGREKLFRLMPLSSEGGREEEDTTDSEEQIVGEGRVGGDLKIDEVALR